MSGTTDGTTKGNAAAALSAVPYDAMLKSTAYERLCAEHPAEFVPASIFFTHDGRSAIDRRNSFRVKAALVYEAVTGRHVDDNMLLANSLLLALARKCHSKINGQPEGNRASPTFQPYVVIRSSLTLSLMQKQEILRRSQTNAGTKRRSAWSTASSSSSASCQSSTK
jgi:hypothetical protein